MRVYLAHCFTSWAFDWWTEQSDVCSLGVKENWKLNLTPFFSLFFAVFAVVVVSIDSSFHSISFMKCLQYKLFMSFWDSLEMQILIVFTRVCERERETLLLRCPIRLNYVFQKNLEQKLCGFIMCSSYSRLVLSKGVRTSFTMTYLLVNWLLVSKKRQFKN